MSVGEWDNSGGICRSQCHIWPLVLRRGLSPLIFPSVQVRCGSYIHKPTGFQPSHLFPLSEDSQEPPRQVSRATVVKVSPVQISTSWLSTCCRPGSVLGLQSPTPLSSSLLGRQAFRKLSSNYPTEWPFSRVGMLAGINTRGYVKGSTIYFLWFLVYIFLTY